MLVAAPAPQSMSAPVSAPVPNISPAGAAVPVNLVSHPAQGTPTAGTLLSGWLTEPGAGLHESAALVSATRSGHCSPREAEAHPQRGWPS